MRTKLAALLASLKKLPSLFRDIQTRAAPGYIVLEEPKPGKTKGGGENESENENKKEKETGDDGTAKDNDKDKVKNKEKSKDEFYTEYLPFVFKQFERQHRR